MAVYLIIAQRFKFVNNLSPPCPLDISAKLTYLFKYETKIKLYEEKQKSKAGI